MVVKLHIEGISKFDDAAAAAFAGPQLIKSAIRMEAGLFAKDLESRAKKQYLSGRIGGDVGLNVVTGRLRSSIRGMVINAEDGVEITLGTDVPYAKWHEQPDGMPKPAKLPRRAFLEPSVKDLYPTFQKTIDGILTKFATEGLFRGQ